jgi:hypothetical protein
VEGVTYTLTYNEENKLEQLKEDSTLQATFTYDGDGMLVKKVEGGVTTMYVRFPQKSGQENKRESSTL